MIGSVSAHRRANAFAQALEEESPARQAEALEADPEQAQLLGVVGELASVPAPALDPGVKVEQRAQLIAAMEAMLAENAENAEGAGDSASTGVIGVDGGALVPAQRRRGAHRATGPLSRLKPRSRFSRGVTIGGLGVGVAAGAFSGAAAASSDALPGDTLYGLKRGMEDLRRGMADGDTERGRIYLDQASTRLNEARRLMERGRAGDLDEESMGEVRSALDSVRDDAGEGHRLLRDAYRNDGSLGPIQTLSAFSQKNGQSWQQLRERLPVQLGQVSDEVSSVFDAIQHDVDPLRSMLPSAEPDTEPGGGEPEAAESGGSADTATPSPSSTSSASGGVEESGEPKPSATEEGGLVGDGGDLVDTGSGSSPSDSSSPTKEQEETPDSDITIPPLLPLPELGLGGGLEEEEE